ncbi:MAG: hypothetical protein PHI85_00780 [Victivallaceae bacterium]|nr:hypothetical protein [Victivallaceae bacterium]
MSGAATASAMRKTLAMLLICTTAFFSAAEENAGRGRIKWWPRLTPAVMPTGISQLAILEFPPDAAAGDAPAKLELTLPDGVRYLGSPTAWINPNRPNVHALPFPERTAKAEAAEQTGNILRMSFASGNFGKEPQTFLPMLFEVNAAPGNYAVKAKIESGGVLRVEELALKIMPPLDPEPCVKPLIVWDYPGVDEPYLPIIINSFTAAGFNRFYEAREELPNRKSATDFQQRFKTAHGIAFSMDGVAQYYKDRPLPAGMIAVLTEKPDCGWMVDHPDESRLLIGEFLAFMTAGKPFQYAIMDCERGAFKMNGEKIVGDLTEYNRRRFAEYAGLEQTPTAAEIAEKYREPWIAYCCRLTAEYAAMFESAVRAALPNCKYEIYSGYQFANGSTRQNYAMNWGEMTEVGMDAAGAGYFGSRKDVRNTAEAIAPTPLIPAEMYMENFNTPGIPSPRLNVDNFAFRLIQVYLWSGCGGMQIWHGGVLTGGGLVAINRFKNFVNATAGITDGAEFIPADDLLTTTPRPAAENIYCFRKDGKTNAIVLNPTDTAAVMRITPATPGGKRLTLKMAPFSYRIEEIQ